MTRALIPLAALLSLGLHGCVDDPETATDVRVPTVLVYSPSTGSIPVPNDLLYSGSTDGTLNLPVADPSDFSDPTVAISALDGWSTSAHFTFGLSRPVDSTTLVAGSTVRIFEVTTAASPTLPVGAPVTGIVSEFTDFTVGLATEDTTNQTVRVIPTAPFSSATTYMVVLTNDIRDSQSIRVAADREFVLASSPNDWEPGSTLAGLQNLVRPMLTAAVGQGITEDSIVGSWTFTTQGVYDASRTLLDVALGNEKAIIDELCAQLPGGCSDTTPSPFSNASIDNAVWIPAGDTSIIPGGTGAADIYLGQLTLPYYLTAATDPDPSGPLTDPVSDPTPLSAFWNARYAFDAGDSERNVTRFNHLPEATGQETIPIILTIPNGVAQPGTGWPLAVFVHGITRQRSDLFGIADGLAAQGIAGVSFDLPLHGETAASPFFSGYNSGQVRERTFGLDLTDNTTGAPGPDGTAEASGTHYINLASLLVTRDNLRQAQVDLFHMLIQAPTIDFDNDAMADIDPSRVHVIGQSLGAMIGFTSTTLVGEVAPNLVASSTLSSPGGGIPRFLIASPQIAPQILAGLAAAGLSPGTSEFEAFIDAAQTTTESGDPINFAANHQALGIQTHVIEIVGDGGSVLPDQVIPPTVEGAPLSGSTPVIEAAGLSQVSATTSDPGGVRAVVRFIAGDHSSLLDPTASLAATIEMQAQAIGIILSSGTALNIADPSVVQ